MKIALIGYGKMGKTIEQIALGRGHQIVSVVDINNPEEIRSDNFKSADVAIEFTTPATAFDNYMQCFAAGVPACDPSLISAPSARPAVPTTVRAWWRSWAVTAAISP